MYKFHSAARQGWGEGGSMPNGKKNEISLHSIAFNLHSLHGLILQCSVNCEGPDCWKVNRSSQQTPGTVDPLSV